MFSFLISISTNKLEEISTDEKRLLESTAHLISQGQPVLLNLYPSFLPRYGQPDPWASLAEQLGIEASTGAVLLQESVDVEGDVVVQMFHLWSFRRPTCGRSDDLLLVVQPYLWSRRWPTCGRSDDVLVVVQMAYLCSFR